MQDTNIELDFEKIIPIHDANINDFLSEQAVNSLFVKKIKEN